MCVFCLGSNDMAEKIDQFLELIRSKDWQKVKQSLDSINVVQLSDVFDELADEEYIVLFRLLPRPMAKEVFQYLSYDQQEEIINGLAANAEKVTQLLNDLDPDDRTAFFEELPGEVSQRLVQMLSPTERVIATRLLGYPEESIGRLMTTAFVAVKPHYTIPMAIDHIREYGEDSETLNMIYIVDEHWKLLADIRMKRIILASPDQTIASLSDNQFIALNAYDDQEEAVKAFKDYDRTALPVVDSDGTLLGIVTVDDILDVAEEENTEDFHKFGGTEGLDLSYTKTSLGEMIKKRAGWLVILFIGEMFTASAMAYYDDEIAKAVVLALFVPLIISSGGNSGSQAASLIIRSLALQELKLRNWLYVMRKELLSGVLLGCILGAIGFCRIALWQTTGIYDYGEFWESIAASVSVALVCIVMWGTVSGAMIPFVLKRAGLDPATASAPFVATMVDVTGLIIYFSIATFFLGGKLL